MYTISSENVGQWLYWFLAIRTICRYEKAFLGELSSNRSGWLKSLNLQFSRCYIFVTFRNKVGIVVQYVLDFCWHQ